VKYLASPIPKTELATKTLEINHVTVTMPIRGQFFFPRLTLEIICLCAKFDDSILTYFRDTFTIQNIG